MARPIRLRTIWSLVGNVSMFRHRGASNQSANQLASTPVNVLRAAAVINGAVMCSGELDFAPDATRAKI
jgi:hypothetical protein